MRRSWLCVVVFFACQCSLPCQSSAQDFPYAEVFVGYSYLHIDLRGVTATSLTNQCATANGGVCPYTFQVHPGFNGWNFAPQFNFTRWLGVKAQISGQYGTVVTAEQNSTPVPIPKQHAYDMLFGAVVSHRAPRYTLFAHALIGGENFGIAESQINSVNLAIFPGISETDTAFSFGGGVDLKVWKHLAIRAGQLDFHIVAATGGRENDFRYSGGIVFSLGGN